MESKEFNLTKLDIDSYVIDIQDNYVSGSTKYCIRYLLDNVGIDQDEIYYGLAALRDKTISYYGIEGKFLYAE